VPPPPQARAEEKARQAAKVDVDSGVLKAIAEAEASRAAGGAGAAGGSPEGSKEIESRMESILQRARQIAESSDAEGKGGEEQLRRDFEGLISALQAVEKIPREDMRRIREAAFDNATFYVTDMYTVEDSEQPELFELYGTGGWIVRGNLREDKGKVFARLKAAVSDLHGDRLVALMIPDPVAPEGPSEGPSEERPAFVVAPRDMVQPPQPGGWQAVVAVVLVLLTAASHFQLGVVANVTSLPPEALQALANPEAFNPEAPIPGMTDDDIVRYVVAALPVAVGAFGANMTHELGHRLAAAVRGVDLGASFYLPNSQLGTFGAITPIKSIVKSLDDLWDVAFAGPLAGGLASLALFLFGLGATLAAGGDADAAAGLIPVPTPLFQGSVLLGSVCHLALGDAAFNGTTVPLHPMTIAGWCGLVTTALNLLPVGCLDGGRMAQSALGRNGLNLTSFFTYTGLALGVIGSSLALPFGLAVILLQRAPERLIQDQVTLASDSKRAVTAAAILFALLTLVPVAPELAGSGGIGPGGPFL